MSFVTAIRDYIETVNTLSNSLGENFTLTNFISETLLYFCKTFQIVFLYIVSLQWIRDFTLLPIILPQVSFSIFKESFFLETPSKTFFEFLEIPDFHQNRFLLGLLNSFFLTLPVSVVHIFTVRRLLIQGIPSAVYSIGGYLAGQILFLTFTLFGFRQILIPWLTLEPLNYLLGMIFIFRTIYSMTRENLIELKGWGGFHSQKYRNFFLTSFLLAWCEQTSIFEYLGNVTLSSNVTLLESFASSNSISTFFTHFLYIFGISIGSILFTLSWGFFFLQIKNLIRLYKISFLSTFIQFLNKGSFVLALALSLTSIPFYGFDYLVTGPLGFVSQDSIFQNTILDQIRVKDFGRNKALLSGVESSFNYVDLDISPFDRGEYLMPNKDILVPLSFEELNYRGERDWITRQKKVSGVTNSRGGFFSLKKIFTPQKKTQTQSSSIESFEKNSLIPTENAEIYKWSELDSNSPVRERFNEFYGINIDEVDTHDIETEFRLIYNSSFPVDSIRTSSLFPLEEKIKQKYQFNPVYKTLLTGDIDLFLKRQPRNFLLNGEQEVDLYNKRRMLESYYDSLRHYSHLPYREEFDLFFDGTKSFSSKVYNQQFKGTWRSVRRLFKLTLSFDSQNSASSKTVLKFDQPLYDFSEKQKFSPYHEELSNQNLESIPITVNGKGNNEILGNATSSNGKRTTKEKGKERQTENKTSFSEPIIKQLKKQGGPEQFSVKELLTSPLYAGWDQNLRKFVITNKFIPRKFAGYQINLDSEINRNFSVESASSFSKQNGSSKQSYSPKRSFGDQDQKVLSDQKGKGNKQHFGKKGRKGRQKIKFTTWPLLTDTNRLLPIKEESSIPYVSLYETISDKTRVEMGSLESSLNTLPSNLKKFEIELEKSQKGESRSSIDESLAPKRGGFIWPGNSKIKLPSFQDS